MGLLDDGDSGVYDNSSSRVSGEWQVININCRLFGCEYKLNSIFAAALRSGSVSIQTTKRFYDGETQMVLRDRLRSLESLCVGSHTQEADGTRKRDGQVRFLAGWIAAREKTHTNTLGLFVCCTFVSFGDFTVGCVGLFECEDKRARRDHRTNNNNRC